MKMTFNIDYEPSDGVLFGELNKKNRQIVAGFNKRQTAQQLLDGVK